MMELEPALETLLSEYQIGIVLTDKALRVVSLSKAARHWCREDVPLTPGSPLTKLIPSLGGSEPELQALANGYTERFELMRLNSGNAQGDEPRVLGFTRQDGDGKPNGLLLAFSQVSDAHHEDLLRQLRLDLFRARQQVVHDERHLQWYGLTLKAISAVAKATLRPSGTAIGEIALAGLPLVRGDLVFVAHISNQSMEVRWWPELEGNSQTATIPLRGDGLGGALEAGLLPYVSINSAHDTLIDEELKVICGPGSLLVFPLVGTDEQTRGLIGWHCSEARRTFTPEEYDVLEALATQAGLVLEREWLQGQLRYQQTHDPLTGLPNHTQITSILDGVLATASVRHQPVSMIVLYVESLREINEQFGIQFGDDLLRAVSASVKARLRQSDQAVRSGAAELALILPGTSTAGAQTLTQALSRAFAMLEVAPGVQASASYGIATFPTNATTSEALLDLARLALNKAREFGPGRAFVARS